jgi:predicted transposase YbfD/YdcC
MGNKLLILFVSEQYLNDTEVVKTSPTCTETDSGHGRIETRTCTVSSNIVWLRERHPAWKTVTTIVCIDSVREMNGLIVKETRYFLSSLPPDPHKILRAVRAHWGIENALHWSLDMTFADDSSRTRKDHAPANLATFRHFALKSPAKTQTSSRLYPRLSQNNRLE